MKEYERVRWLEARHRFKVEIYLIVAFEKSLFVALAIIALAKMT